MLNADEVVPVPGFEVLAWADHASLDVVWALPARPRLTSGPTGLAEIDLLLYRRRGERALMGGQLTLTVDVALTDDERAAAAHAADGRRPQPPTGERPLPPVEVRAPLWTSGTVCAHPVADLPMQGTPSLLADNRCLLTAQLDAAGAAKVAAAWDDGFADATIELLGAVDGVTTAATAAQRTTTGNGGHAATATVTARAAATTPKPVALSLRGPLRLPAAVRDTRRTVVDL